MKKYRRLIEFLLENAGVSIKYRVKKEILNVSVESDEMQKLQAEILNLPRVKKAFAAQKEDGFIGNVIHGVYFDGFDSTVNLLKRYGVEITNPNLQRAKESLLNWKNYERDHFYKAGNAMDEHGRGGFRAILADILVELGAEESAPQIQEQISYALNAFRGAMNYTCVDDFSKKATMKGVPCRYYIKGSTFPASNHISILEKTFSWRTTENLTIVEKSYWHCKEIMKDYNDGIIYVNCGHFVGPFNYNWNNVHHDISMQDFEACPINFAWFMRELSAVSNKKAIFNDDNPYFVESLEKMIESENIEETVTDEQLRLFKKYAAIEPSWRKKESIACDLYFPILLALSRILK
ncbi:MAG: hypothetical protein IKQ25_10565 [Lachnospiraceae bacterium]|nr:hypothetical protein [Lachnospiraceae bacterium]